MIAYASRTSWSLVVSMGFVLLLAGCSGSGGQGDDGGLDGGDPDAGVLPDIEELTFGAFEPWAEPIEDWIINQRLSLGHMEFNRAITDLIVWDDRLWFGYGDATLNLGPVDLRHFTEPEPEAVAWDFTTDEEQVDQYRHLGEVLAVPGVDATEDGLMGNAYTLSPGGSWYKSRTLEMAWHVHDIAVLDDVVYACGSGGTLDDYNNSTVKALFFRSQDGGRTFETVAQIPHPDPPGDHRFTHLLAVGDAVYALGYRSDLQVINGFVAFRQDADGFAPYADWPYFFVTHTASLTSDLGLVVGVDVSSDPLTWGCLMATPDSGFSPAAICEGKTVLDVEPLGDGRALLLYLSGDAYPVDVIGPWEVGVGLTTDGTDLTELTSQTLETMPDSIAFWRGSLYLGMSNGQVWHSPGSTD